MELLSFLVDTIILRNYPSSSNGKTNNDLMSWLGMYSTFNVIVKIDKTLPFNIYIYIYSYLYLTIWEILNRYYLQLGIKLLVSVTPIINKHDKLSKFPSLV